MAVPAGSLMLAQGNLRALLSNSATLQTWTSTANPTAALARIYHDGLPKPGSNAPRHTLAELQALRPYAIIWTDTEKGYGRTQDGYGAGPHLGAESGRLMIELVQDVPLAIADDIAEADLQWKNTIGQILDDLVTLIATGTYLLVNSLSIDEGPYRYEAAKQSEMGDAQGVEIGVGWGFG